MDWKELTTPKYLNGDRNTTGRNDFERDHDRVIFSSAFRRLNDKTQVLPIPENYFVHNRMTHSIETSCIGRSLGQITGLQIAEKYKIENKEIYSKEISNIIEASCLAHDIGNPPFGHSGEDSISSFFEDNEYLLKDFKPKEKEDLLNFEGNSQGFRIISNTYTDLRLTQNVLATFTKYPRESIIESYKDEKDRKRKDQKKYGFFQTEKDVFVKVSNTFGLKKISNDNDLAFARFPLSYLVEAADDICYLIIDIEDACRLNLIDFQKIKDSMFPLILKEYQDDVNSRLKTFNDNNDKMSYLRAQVIHSLIVQCGEIFIEKSHEIINGNFESTLINDIQGFSSIKNVKQLAREYLYNYRPVLEIEAAGFEVVSGLLDLIIEIKSKSESRKNKKISTLFPTNITNNNLNYESLLEVTDYISGMTDNYAINLYNKIRGIEYPKLY